ncbi:hypothetical protein, variant [Aphanomyces invadans]|nr:hypothetical protein, variant [Aphanomyces invadans]ETW07450.1 hypothetical protein, variant [Aphanomyces invadans]|eukprot:XP_008863543.1 hypothetical protein, variant [Aphanomyces invadans]
MYEADCDTISSQKVALVQANPSAFFGSNGHITTSDKTSLSATVHHEHNGTASTYSAFACDLGNIPMLQNQLTAYGLDPSLPTLVLAECVLAYLAPAASTALLKWACATFADCMLVTYDPIGLADAFGHQLQRYFEAKGCTLRSASIMASIPTYTRLLRHVGWQCIRLDAMNAIYDALTDAPERTRVAGLEPFDEFEDWILTNHHYGVLVATNQIILQNGASKERPASAALEAVLKWPATAASLMGTTTSHQLFSSIIVTIRPFQVGDERDVRRIFEAGHLPTSSKSVRKLVSKALQSDLANIPQTYLSPGSLAGFWVATVHDASTDGTSHEHKRKVVGCVALKPHDGAEVAELCRLAIDAQSRRLGIASKLVDALERHAFDACGYRAIVLDTLGTMEAAKMFYAGRGYHLACSTTVGVEGLVIESFKKERRH